MNEPNDTGSSETRLGSADTPQDDELSSTLAVPVETLSPAAKRRKSLLHIIFAIIIFLALTAIILILIKTLSS